jgi:hypothetical protein
MFFFQILGQRFKILGQNFRKTKPREKKNEILKTLRKIFEKKTKHGKKI